MWATKPAPTMAILIFGRVAMAAVSRLNLHALHLRGPRNGPRTPPVPSATCPARAVLHCTLRQPGASATEAPPAQQQRDAGEADGAVGGQRALHTPALGHGPDQERADGEDAAPDQRVDAHHPPSQ